MLVAGIQAGVVLIGTDQRETYAINDDGPDARFAFEEGDDIRGAAEKLQWCNMRV